MAHKTKAESSFEKAVKDGLGSRDFAAVETAYARYGHYLELVGEDQPVGKRRFFQYPPPKLRDKTPETAGA